MGFRKWLENFIFRETHMFCEKCHRPQYNGKLEHGVVYCACAMGDERRRHAHGMPDKDCFMHNGSTYEKIGEFEQTDVFLRSRAETWPAFGERRKRFAEFLKSASRPMPNAAPEPSLDPCLSARVAELERETIRGAVVAGLFQGVNTRLAALENGTYIPMPDENSSAAEQESKFNPEPLFATPHQFQMKPKPAIPPLPTHPWFRMATKIGHHDSDPNQARPQFDMLGDGTGWHDIARLIPHALEICCAVAFTTLMDEFQRMEGCTTLNNLNKRDELRRAATEWRDYLASRTVSL